MADDEGDSLWSYANLGSFVPRRPPPDYWLPLPRLSVPTVGELEGVREGKIHREGGSSVEIEPPD